jgi:hypothetical protein
LARRDPSRRIILTSGPSDAHAAKEIAGRARTTLGPFAGAVPEIGEFDLAELRALVSRAAVYIGGDSGPLHVAGTTTTPIVALFGPTLAERSLPWRDPRWFAEAVDAGPLECRPCRQRECAPGDFRCLTRITAEHVAAAAERAIAYMGNNWGAARTLRVREASPEGSPRTMTTAAMTVTHPRLAHGLERATVVLLLCFVASLQISIAAANILLALMLVCLDGTARPGSDGPGCPLLFLAVGGNTRRSRLSCQPFRLDAATSILDDKQLLLFVIVPAVYQIARGERASLVVDVIVSVGAASAAYGIIQYGPAALRQPRPDARRGHVALHDLFGTADARHLRRGCSSHLRPARGAPGRRW